MYSIVIFLSLRLHTMKPVYTSSFNQYPKFPLRRRERSVTRGLCHKTTRRNYVPFQCYSGRRMTLHLLIVTYRL